MDNNLDERQLLARGKIFKHTTFLFIGLLFLESVLQSFFEITFFEGMWSKPAIILTAITAMSAEMIWRDAYPLTGKGRAFLFGFLGIAGLACLIIGIVEFAVSNETLTSGKSLSETAALLFFSVLFIFSGVIYIVKLVKSKTKKEDE